MGRGLMRSFAMGLGLLLGLSLRGGPLPVEVPV